MNDEEKPIYLAGLSLVFNTYSWRSIRLVLLPYLVPQAHSVSPVFYTVANGTCPSRVHAMLLGNNDLFVIVAAVFL